MLKFCLICIFAVLCSVFSISACSAEGAYVSNYEDLYFRLLEYSAGPGYDAGFDVLPPAVQHLFIAAVFDMEIQNGGICQYLANWGTESAVRVAESLRAIGLQPVAALYEGFLDSQQIDTAVLDGFRCETAEEFVELYQKYPEADAFDNAYMKLWQNLGFENVMMEYAQRNL